MGTCLKTSATFFLLFCVSLTLVTIPLSSTPALALGSGRPAANSRHLMVSFGDSITAGAFAKYDGPGEIVPRRSPLVMGVGGPAEGEPYWKRLLETAVETKETLSWASGGEIHSHHARLKRALASAVAEPPRVDVMNVARSGDRIEHLMGQLDSVMRKWSSGRYDSIKYVTLFIGANDVCDREPRPADALKEDLFRFFARLASIRQEEPIRVLMSSIPSVPELGRSEIRHARTIYGPTCHQIRDRALGFCKRIVQWETADEFDAGYAQVVELNRILAGAAALAEAYFPQLDVHFTSQLFDLRIELDDMAIDCFHPNAVGQSRIAQELWNEQPWF